MKRYIVLVCITINIIVIALVNSAFAKDFKLLSNTTPASRSDILKYKYEADSINTQKITDCDVNDAVLTPNLIKVNDNLIVEGLTTKTLTALVDKTDININDTYTIRARIKGYPQSYILISSTDNKILGDINIPELNKSFILLSNAPNARGRILEADANVSNSLADSECLIPNVPSINALNDLPPGLQDSITTIDAIIVYTPNASNWANISGGGISNVIAQAMAKAQLALDNSQTNVIFRLAYSGLVNYTESGSSTTDLMRFTYAGDNYLDDIQTLRNQYDADVCTIFTQCEDTGGIGWLLDSAMGLPDYAFNLVRVQQAGWTYTYIHEVGHNLGCHHRRDQVTQPGPGLFPYSAGWRWIGNDAKKYASVMSYEEDGYVRVGYFSNHSILYQGVATGTPNDDNARTIREIKDVVAIYRIPVSGVSLNNLSLSMSKGNTYLLTATVSPSNASNKSISWSSNNSNVAKVDENGLVSAVGAGSCNITATTVDGSKTAVCSVFVNEAPVVVGVSPNSGSASTGIKKTFSSTFSDANGADDLYMVRLLVNTTATIAGGVQFIYIPSNNSLQMTNNAGQWSLGKTLGSDNIIETENAILDCKNTTVTKNGNVLTVNWQITFKTPMSGKNCYLYEYVSDSKGLSAGWTNSGTCLIGTELVNAAPVIVGVSPSLSSVSIGVQQTFTSTYSDSNGVDDLYLARLLINTTATIAGGVQFIYIPSNNSLQMTNNAGQWMVGKTLGSDNIIESENAILDCKNTTITKIGNVLNLNWQIIFKTPMRDKNCYLYGYISDKQGAAAGWSNIGSVSITP